VCCVAREVLGTGGLMCGQRHRVCDVVEPAVSLVVAGWQGGGIHGERTDFLAPFEV